MSYYIENQRGIHVNISADEQLAEFCIPETDVAEHLQAQITYHRTQDNTHKVQPIMIGVTGEKYLKVVDHLCEKYKGFLRNYFVMRNYIPIKLNSKGNEVIRIVNEDVLALHEK